MSQIGQTQPKELATNPMKAQLREARNGETEISMDEATAGNLSGHRQTLGICWIVYGILRLIAGIWLVLFSGTSTVMFGALLTRVPNPFALMGDFHIVYAGLVVLSLSMRSFRNPGRSGTPGKSTVRTRAGPSCSIPVGL
jgi:hypothetical protein